MNEFVLRLVVLSVLWAFCEMLLPEGKIQQMARFTVSLLVMLSLLSSVTAVLKTDFPFPAEQPVLADSQGAQGSERIFLQTRANQLRSYLIQQAGRSGYQTDATVYLLQTGAVERIDLTLWKREEEPPLMNVTALRQMFVRMLELPEEKIRIMLMN